jgi:hypothetical protein
MSLFVALPIIGYPMVALSNQADTDGDGMGIQKNKGV